VLAASPRCGLLFGLFRVVPGAQAPTRRSYQALEMSKVQAKGQLNLPVASD